MAAVSILLTCYNHLAHLPECVAGVAAQTLRDWELVAIDDGSTDGTREWLEACPLPMKRVFNETNLGTYGSLNRALAMSTGKYVAVLNDDDVWLPRKLEVQVAALESDPRVGFSHTFGRFVDAGSREITGENPLGFAFPRTPSGDALPALMAHNQVINSAALVRRSALDTAGRWDAGFYGCGDWHMWLRIARDHDVHFAEEELTLYRVHPENASRDVAKMHADSRRIREWLATWRAEEFAGRPGMRRAIALNWAALGVERMRDGERGAARQALRESLRLEPRRWKTYARLAATWVGR